MANGKVVIGTFTNGKLSFKIIEAEKAVRSIEWFIVFPVATLHFMIKKDR